jgi:magnesium-transporting ATPase (P-type)
MLLNSSLPKGICYVETKSLDGETNLKHKSANKEVSKLSESLEQMIDNFSECQIECELPNASIYTLSG